MSRSFACAWQVTLQKKGYVLFSFTSEAKINPRAHERTNDLIGPQGELGYDYLQFFVGDNELGITTKTRTATQWLAVKAIDRWIN